MFDKYGLINDQKFFTEFKKMTSSSPPAFYLTGAPVLFIAKESELCELIKENDFTVDEEKLFFPLLSIVR